MSSQGYFHTDLIQNLEADIKDSAILQQNNKINTQLQIQPL